MKINRFFILIFAILLLYIFAYNLFSVKCFDYKIYDTALKVVKKISPKNKKSSVVVVDIDEKSLEQIGQWPWSRLLLAKILDNVSEAYPANIGFDILFSENDKTSIVEIKRFFKKYFQRDIVVKGVDKRFEDNDKVFAKILKMSGVTLPVYMTNQTKNRHCYVPPKNRENFGIPTTSYNAESILCNIDILQKAALDIGFINVEPDSDGILRRVPMFIKYKNFFIPSFAMANIMNVDSIFVKNNEMYILSHRFKMDSDSNILINYNDAYKTISALDVLRGNYDKKLFTGKFVLIGASAIGLHDNYTLSGSKSVPGVFIQASLLDEILQNRTIYQPQFLKILNLFLSFVLSLLLAYFGYKRQYIKVFATFFVTLFVYLGATLLFLSKGIYISSGFFIGPYIIFFVLINLVFVFLHYKEERRFNEEISKAHSGTIDSMSIVAETRDADTGAHIFRTKEYMRILANYLYEHDLYKKELSGDFRKYLYRAAPLHDIGKVGIPDHILKKPGPLNKEEYEIMKRHSVIGKQIIENAMKNNKDNRFLQIAYNIAYYHHERWDGSGYPRGLKKEEIPLEARMMALVDVYDALISQRYYKKSFSYEESNKIIIKGSGTHFDPILVGAFVEIKDQFRKIAEKY